MILGQFIVAVATTTKAMERRRLYRGSVEVEMEVEVEVEVEAEVEVVGSGRMVVAVGFCSGG